MNVKQEPQTPVLEEPGAGLPLFEAKFLRWILAPMFHRCLRPHRISKIIASDFSKLRTVIESFSEEASQIRVLVKREMGLEDSSRHWSAAMTMKHLVMVHSGIFSVLREMEQGTRFEPTIEIAKFKPDDLCHLEMEMKKFASLSHRYLDWCETVSWDTLGKNGLRVRHPWFGPMDGKAWHILWMMHQKIHFKQILQIQRSIGNQERPGLPSAYLKTLQRNP